ncbi:MAG TPA: multiheme c-type cytochrome, partial [Myxococcota bacterium]|nr:multiheme c-type cytochrome [Myxococcota bacterium]
QWICTGETCGNGIDDDDNGLRDCADPACLGDPSCHGDTCDDPWVLPGTAVVNVDTRPLTAGFPAGCEATPGTDIVFRLDVPVVSDVHVSTLGSDYDTAASLRAAPCTAATHLACNDDIGPRIDASRLEIRGLAAGTWFLRVSDASGGDGGRLRLNVVVTPTKPANWPATTRDPLVRMPGTQPTDGLTLEAPANCTGCHGGYDPAVEPSRTWRGSMMAQASRDFLFWASMAVAIQDSLWALGTPNAADLCERCHFPQGWVEGRSDPPNASLMTGSDYDGVHCDVCHSMVDPHFEDTFAGTREGADWAGYWDETNASATPSSTAAATTRTADRTAVSTARFYNGTPYFGADFRPVPAAWNENASGQFFLSAGKPKRAPFADAGAKHQILYSRHHKSRYFCATCHDVTNPALSNLDYAGLPPGPGVPALPSETLPAWDMTHVERTFSEFMLSAFGAPGGAPGTGTFAPDVFVTSHPGNAIATCQDCHMADLRAMAANKGSAVLRPDDSIEHPKSGMPDHAMAGGNPFVLRVLASTVAGSPNYDAVNAGLLNGKSTTLTLDMNQGLKVDAAVALEGADKALAMLAAAASIEGLSYTPGTGATTFRVVNHTGHKLLTGFPEGRRVFVNVRAWQGATLLAEINPYDAAAGTLKGLPPDESPASPALADHEEHEDDLVYECRMASSLTGEEHTFHFVLSTHRQKDNRVPPRGFRIADAPARKAEPVEHGEPEHDMFTAAEYAGGHDAVALELPPGATRVEVTLYYQATSREYVAFLRDEINGLAATLSSPTPTGEALTYVTGSLPFFDRLRAWGDVIWQLWDHNRNVPGAAPVPMAQAVWGS